MNKITEIEQPTNANERFQYAVVIRLDAIMAMLSSLIEAYASQNQVALTSNGEQEVALEEEKVVERREEEVKEEIKEVKPVAKRKRAATKK